MKASRLLLVLALCLLVSNSYAIRIPRVNSKPLEIQVINDGEKVTINGGAKAIIASKDNEDCSSTSGKFRKLMISTISSPSIVPTTITSKSMEKGANKVDRLVAEEPSSGVANERKLESVESEAMSASSQDTEYGDITEMDYSPAKRKPPIHN